MATPAPTVITPSAAAVLALRGDCRDGSCYSYKLLPGNGKFESAQYGLDAVYSSDPGVDENEMSFILHFADGNRRDGVGDLLNVEGIDTSRHRVNPIALWDHGKTVSLPIGLTETRDTREYTVFIDPVARTAKAKVYVYQSGASSEHLLFCEQAFDMWAKRIVRAGSIGYQVVEAEELPQDWRRGIPKGLLLNRVLMLEASAVVLPANGDTVRKFLSQSRCCGKPISPYLVKSLEPYAAPKKAQMGWEPGRAETKAAVETAKNLDPNDPVSKAYRQGYDAGRDNLSEASCPFTDPQRRDAWQSGYDDAKRGNPDLVKVKTISSIRRKYAAKRNATSAEVDRGNRRHFEGRLAKPGDPYTVETDMGTFGATNVDEARSRGRGYSYNGHYTIRRNRQEIERKAYATDHLEARDDYDNPLSNSTVPTARWSPGEGEKIKTVVQLRRKYLLRKSWEGFRARALQLGRSRGLPEQRLLSALEQYHDGDIRVEELLGEFPALADLAREEGIKAFKGIGATSRGTYELHLLDAREHLKPGDTVIARDAVVAQRMNSDVDPMPRILGRAGDRLKVLQVIDANTVVVRGPKGEGRVDTIRLRLPNPVKIRFASDKAMEPSRKVVRISQVKPGDTIIIAVRRPRTVKTATLNQGGRIEFTFTDGSNDHFPLEKTAVLVPGDKAMSRSVPVKRKSTKYGYGRPYDPARIHDVILTEPAPEDIQLWAIVDSRDGGIISEFPSRREAEKLCRDMNWHIVRVEQDKSLGKKAMSAVTETGGGALRGPTPTVTKAITVEVTNVGGKWWLYNHESDEREAGPFASEDAARAELSKRGWIESKGLTKAAKKPKLPPIRSLRDLRDPKYAELAKVASSNLGGPSGSVDAAIRWLETNAMEAGEEGVVDEVNYCRDLVKSIRRKSLDENAFLNRLSGLSTVDLAKLRDMAESGGTPDSQRKAQLIQAELERRLNVGRRAASLKAMRTKAGKWTIQNTNLEKWFERDRQHVELSDKATGRTIVEWWDEDVTEAIEGGFLNPRNLHQSAIDYANSHNMKSLPNHDQDTDDKALTVDERDLLQEARQVLSKPTSYEAIAGMTRDEARRIVAELERKIGSGPAVRRPRPVLATASMKGITGYVSDRIGRWQIIEGSGRYGGEWYATSRGDIEGPFKTRQEAVQFANDEKSLRTKDLREGMRVRLVDGRPGRIQRATSDGSDYKVLLDDGTVEHVRDGGLALEPAGTVSGREKRLPAVGAKSLSTLRKKYKSRSAKGLRRRLKSGRPGSTAIRVKADQLDDARQMAEAKGLKFQHLGEADGVAKVKLIGDDDQADEVAKAFGQRVR